MTRPFTTDRIALAAAILVAVAPGRAEEAVPASVQKALGQHCAGCHGPEKPKGNFRIDRLTTDFGNDDNRSRWADVLEQLSSGAMPPKGKPRPTADEQKAIIGWVRDGERRAAEVRRRQGRVVARRLNRIEYENTVRDLLGVSVELRDLLPPDSSANGFDNVARALHTSPFLMAKYLEGAEKALDIAIANGPRPKLIQQRYRLTETHSFRSATERVYRKTEAGEVIGFSSSAWNAVILSPFYPPDRGRYRFRISASAVQSAGKPVTFRVDAGTLGMAGTSKLVSYFDAPPGKPRVIEFVEELEARSTIRIHPYGLANAQTVDKIGADNYDGPGLAVQWVEVEGPIHDSWPPTSHRAIFGDLPQAKATAPNRYEYVEVVSKAPLEDARTILRRFAGRAFRRAVTEAEIEPFLKLVRQRLDQKASFERAVRVGLLAIMVAPEFLFLQESPGPLEGPALANRLSYFLWSTMPDAELLRLAQAGKLSDPRVLREQVDRMLADRKAASFTENFVGQWLNLRDIDATLPSHILYPEYDEMLKESMLRESYAFFDEVLKRDLSVANFVQSDFAMLNGRLARHYGLPGIDGWEFRRVPLPKDSHRGGVLTMASVLKVTANGTYTSPILRGAFVLERILGTPPPRPPDGIAAVEPDIRGATTIRQQLEKHRATPACAGCHAKIDPPGFALESFDVIGGWREHYRSTGNGKAVTRDGRTMPYLQGLAIAPSYKLADGRAFRDIDEFKALLVKDREQVARNLAERLATYATGAAPQLDDKKEIEAVLAKAKDKDYGLRSLIHEIVQSRLFREK